MNTFTKRAVREAFVKLSPREQIKNPVMLTVYISAILTFVLFVLSLFGISDSRSGFTLAISAILWLTVLFANFAEAVAEGRGKAQADSLRAAKRDVDAHKLTEALLAKAYHVQDPAELVRARAEEVSSASLKKKDLFFVSAGEQIPADGEIVMGAASVDESAITGESAPVIRESGGDRSAVTGGTTVLSDWLIVRVSADAGHSFLDQMIAMVESASRKKTPNELALEILLVALTLVFLLVAMSLFTFSGFSAGLAGAANPISLTSLVALFVCLAPTTIGALLSAIGIAGMSRLNQANVLAMSGRAVEAAGDVDVLLLDKTGTITLGNRQACEFVPVDGATEREVADAAQLASLTDETPEGRSIVVLAKERFGIRARELSGAGMVKRSLHGSNAHERRGLRGPFDQERRGGCGAQLRGVWRRGVQLRMCGGGRAHLTCGRYASSGGARPQDLGRGASEGHCEAGNQGEFRRSAHHGHQDGHDHRR